MCPNDTPVSAADGFAAIGAGVLGWWCGGQGALISRQSVGYRPCLVYALSLWLVWGGEVVGSRPGGVRLVRASFPTWGLDGVLTAGARGK